MCHLCVCLHTGLCLSPIGGCSSPHTIEWSSPRVRPIPGIHTNTDGCLSPTEGCSSPHTSRSSSPTCGEKEEKEKEEKKEEEKKEEKNEEDEK